MLAACKAALTGLGPSSGGSSSSPSDRQAESFARAISEARPELVAAYVAESRLLLLSPLKCHPARSTAWHLAAAVRGAAAASGRGSSSGAAASGGGGGNGSGAVAAGGAAGTGGSGPGPGQAADHGPGSEMLALLRRLYTQCGFSEEGLADLLAAPNKRGQTCLHVAASTGNAGAVRFLLAHGGGEGLLLLLRPDKAGRTAMHAAAAAGSLEVAKLLLAGAEAEDARAGGRAAAGVSGGVAGAEGGAGGAGAAAGPAERERGSAGSSGGSGGSSPASPSTQASSGAFGRSSSPGQQQQQQQSAVWRLVCGPDASGLTPLHFAAAANSLPLVRLLLSRGASVAAAAATDVLEAAMPCSAGWTALHVAAMRGHYEVAAAVLRHHASRTTEQQVADWRPGRNCRTSDPRALADRRGTTAASLAASRSFHELAALLDPAIPLASALGIEQGTPVGPDGREVRPPPMFLCPITQEVMREPVVASDGFTYERAAICKWMAAGKLTSPMTNLPFAARALYPNNVLNSAIKEWRQAHQLPEPSVRRPRGAAGMVGDPNNAAGGGDGAADPFLSHLRMHGLS